MLTHMSEGNSDDYLRERYGNPQRAKRRWLIPALLLLVVGGGWLFWSANHYSRPEIRTDLISFTVADPKSVALRYFISVRTASRSHQCILRASDYQANTVGEITDTIPAGVHSSTRDLTIPTRSQAVSATIEHCF